MSFQDDNPFASPRVVEEIRYARPGSELATLGERFLGSLIDGLILLPLAFGAGMMLGIVLVVMGMPAESPAFSLASRILGTLIGIAVFLLINGFLLATRGQTVGKVVMKTQIVSDDGMLVPLGPLVLKRYVPLWLVTNLPYIGFLAALANALAIFRENRKCIHDEIAGTKVIQVNRV